MKLGLTEVESDTYIYLIRNSPATGYQIAKATGKPTPNTYKAIKTLQDKGAIIVENGHSKLCRAVPPDEFLDGLERNFSGLKVAASRHLARLTQAPDDEGVYHLHSPVQVYERIRRMLASCEKVALLDLFPNAVAELASSMQAASSRGIIVCAKVYTPPGTLVHDRGFIAVHDPDGEQTIERWQGIWANAVVDGRQHLISYLSQDGQRVYQAVWSACTFVSWVYNSA